MKDKAVVLYSGGPDSYITYKWAKDHDEFDIIETLYVGVGHRYLNEEVTAVLTTVPNSIVEMTLCGMGPLEKPNGFIFGRNAFLCLCAARHLPEGGTIILSVQQDEMEIADRSETFLHRMSDLVSTLVGNRIEVRTPWWDHDKTDMVEWFLKVATEEERSNLLLTHSCYRPIYHKSGMWANNRKALPCGNCAACFRRAVAFELNNIVEIHAVDPFRSDIASEYRRKAMLGYYSEKRCDRIQQALDLRKK